MTLAQAEAAALALKAVAEDWGVRTSVELQAGRGTDPWLVPIKYHRMWHHTVSTYVPGGNLTPVLWIVKAGRPDVIGPLANGYIGYDRVFRILCMGEANHPGLGGPITIDGVRIPENSARKPTFGIEVEGGIQTWEEIDDKGPDMLEVMGRVDNALAEWSHRPVTSQMEHKTWAPDRKVDRKDFDEDRIRGIALTRKWDAIVNPPTPPPAEQEDDDMAYDMIIRAEGRSPLYVRGDVAIPLRFNASVKGLAEGGKVLEAPVAPEDYDRIVASLNAPELVDDVSIPNP